MEKRISKAAVFIALLTLTACIAASCGAKKDVKNTDAYANGIGNDEYAPVSSITLTESEAAALSGSVKVRLYFKTQKGDKISYETKLLKFTEEDKRADVLASKIIEMLIAGPSNSVLVNGMPEGTALNSVRIKGGVAYVDFNEAFAKAMAEDSGANLTAYCIANTLTEFKNVTEVAITACGNKIESTSGCNFSKLVRNTDVVTDIESAAPKTDYSENVFLEIELE